MSTISESPMGETLPAEWQAKINQCLTPGEITAVMTDYKVASGRYKKDWDPNILIPNDEFVEQSATFKKSFTINGQTRTIESATELGLAQAETALFKSLMAAPAAAATEPTRDTDGRFVSAEDVVDTSELRTQMIRGEITPEEFVARSGIIERVVDQRAARTFETSWEQATAAALASPEFANWPGGNDQLFRISETIKQNNLIDAADKTEALKAAWAAMQQQDYDVALNEKLKTASPDELRAEIGYGRSSGLFGQR